MSVIATAIAADGATRIFFDLRPPSPGRADELRIAAVIERALEPLSEGSQQAVANMRDIRLAEIGMDR
jgi:hypothetical protein